MMPTATKHVAAVAALSMAVGTMALLDAGLAAHEGTREAREESLIQRVVSHTTRSGLAIRSVRDMRAGTVSGKHEGWMRVETTLTPAGSFSWSVIEEGGSDRTREKVFRAVLQTEAASWHDRKEREEAALTPANYILTPMPGASDEIRIRLQPRRQDPKLVDGILTVNADGYPVRLEGKLAKSPSFWVKSVNLIKRYDRFAGVALPTLVETTADLRFLGKSTFTMQYSYQEVNGRSFSRAAATTNFNQ